MRVAYVCGDHGVPAFGRKGSSVHVQAVLRTVVARGDDVHLLTTAPVGTPPPELTGVRVHHLPTGPSTERGGREVRNQEADALVGPILTRLHRETPLGLVYERYSLWGRTATAWAAAARVPSLLEVNAPLVEEQATHRWLVDRDRAENVATQALSSAGAVLCVTEAVARWARCRMRDPEHAHVLGNGVDTLRIRPSGRPVKPATGPFTVGFVGTLKPWHGVDLLVDATALLVAEDPMYRLLVVGDGPLATTLQERAASAGIAAQVEMTGGVSPHDVPALLHRFDVATAPYPPIDDFYFSPLKVYEYLGAGLPVVASRVGGLTDVLDHGRIGVLVEPGDTAALAAAVADLRADPARRDALGRAARLRAVARHDWSSVVGSALSLARVGVVEVPRAASR
ncbi:MAG: glycosyltransferase family 4 protein [Nocardioidaceae bacterium]